MAKVSTELKFLRVLLIWAALLFLGYLWVKRMEPVAPVAPAELASVPGVRLVYRYECGRCHYLELPGCRGTMGPTLVGIGKRQPRAYLEESLKEPSRVVARGYLNGMPSFASLPSAELRELVDYLSTL